MTMASNIPNCSTTGLFWDLKEHFQRPSCIFCELGSTAVSATKQPAANSTGDSRSDTSGATPTPKSGSIPTNRYRRQYAPFSSALPSSDRFVGLAMVHVRRSKLPSPSTSKRCGRLDSTIIFHNPPNINQPLLCWCLRLWKDTAGTLC